MRACIPACVHNGRWRRDAAVAAARVSCRASLPAHNIFHLPTHHHTNEQTSRGAGRPASFCARRSWVSLCASRWTTRSPRSTTGCVIEMRCGASVFETHQLEWGGLADTFLLASFPAHTHTGVWHAVAEQRERQQAGRQGGLGPRPQAHAGAHSGSWCLLGGPPRVPNWLTD